MSRPPVSVESRFWPKVFRTEWCWIWQAGLNVDGYGKFTFQGESRGAHRVSYELAFGGIGDGLGVLHHCDNRRCVRPSHLFEGTNADNNADMVKKGRQALGEKNGAYTKPEKIRRGELNGRAILTAAQVVDIRSKLKAGISQRALADCFGISKSMIGNIARGEAWRIQ